jgi:hypothetical protein
MIIIQCAGGSTISGHEAMKDALQPISEILMIYLLT